MDIGIMEMVKAWPWKGEQEAKAGTEMLSCSYIPAIGAQSLGRPDLRR